mgnify:FL=1
MQFSYGYSVSSDGSHGTWWASTDENERASGTWRIGSWDVCENNTPITNDEWDQILDDPDFWQGGTESYHVGSWDGTEFTYDE